MLKQIKSSLTSWACSMEGVSAGGSHALQQWQTVINTHKLSDSNYTLRLASILPHFQSIHALCPRAVTFQQRNAIEPTRAGQEVNKNWSNQTSSVCLILLVRDPGWLVEVWCVVVPVMLTFVVFCSQGSKPVIYPATLVWINASFWEVTVSLPSGYRETRRVSFNDAHTLKAVDALVSLADLFFSQ